MGDEKGALDYQKYYPSKTFQLNWIGAYLENFNTINGRNNPTPSKNEVICTKIIAKAGFTQIKIQPYLPKEILGLPPLTPLVGIVI